jgi:hypothetical protein
MKKYLVLVLLGLTGCAGSIKNIDTSHASPESVNQCLNGYNQCMLGGPAVGLRTEQNGLCHDSYEVCIKTASRSLTLNK